MTDWKQCAQAHEMELPQFRFASGESKTLRLHCWTLRDQVTRDQVTDET
jgi:hypothetical protein